MVEEISEQAKKNKTGFQKFSTKGKLIGKLFLELIGKKEKEKEKIERMIIVHTEKVKMVVTAIWGG